MVFCAISDSVPEDPVFAPKTGMIYERRLIEVAIKEDGKCPVTGQELASEDLLAVKSKRAIRPRPASATSIPGLLSTLQQEWEAAALETAQLKRHLDTVRQELSQSLYQHDAAMRVIARLVRERDEARAALSNASAIASNAAAGAGGSVPVGEGISPAVMGELLAKNKALRKSHKKRKKAAREGLVTEEAVAAFKCTSSHTPHLSTTPGITCLDVHPTRSELVATGGNDQVVRLFDSLSSTSVATLSGHSKRISSVVFHPENDIVLSSSHDQTVRVWVPTEGTYSSAFTLKPHSGGICGMSLHPSNNYIVSAAMDRTWSFSNISTGAVLTQVKDESIEAAYSASALHPDGLIVATGTEDSHVYLWDVQQNMKNVAKLAGHTGAIRSLAFSSNGFHLATAGHDGVVKLWDLRELKKISEFEVGSPLASVAFDASGSFFAAGSVDDLRLFETSSWRTVNTLEQKGPVTGVKWGAQGKSLVSCSMDRSLKFWA